MYWSVILGFPRISRCQEPESVFLLFVFILSEKFVWVGSQVEITLWILTDDCNIYWFNVLGLILSDYGELRNLCILFD